MSAAPAVALRTENLTRSFGRLAAVDGVSMTLPAGSRHALIGPNGAGKTTLINLLTGVLEPSAGEVYLGDQRITGLRPNERVKRGLTRTFQVTNLFSALTVLESVLLAIHERKGIARQWYRPVATRGEDVDEARELLAKLHLEGDAKSFYARRLRARQAKSVAPGAFSCALSVCDRAHPPRPTRSLAFRAAAEHLPSAPRAGAHPGAGRLQRNPEGRRRLARPLPL